MMNGFRLLITAIKEKSGKKLAGITLLTMVLVTGIVFSTVLVMNNYGMLKMLDQYILEGPKVVKQCQDEIETRRDVFEEDVMARGELGLQIYRKSGKASETEDLKKICSTISAESVSLISESGQILKTSGIVMPEEVFEEKIKEIESGKPLFVTYPISSGGENSDDEDGKALVAFPPEDEEGNRLVIEFAFKPLLDLYNALNNSEGLLNRILSGLNAYIFMQTDDGELAGYPLNGVREEEKDQLFAEISRAFNSRGRFINLGGETSYRLISFMRRPAIAVLLPCPEYEASLLLTVPMEDFISTGVYCTVTLSVFIFLSLILYIIYSLKLSGRNKADEEGVELRRKTERKTGSGRILMLAAIACFSAMLLFLEGRATIVSLGTTKRVTLQYDIGWHENQREQILDTYKDIYRTRTESLAKLLTEHREYRTRSDLQDFADILRVEYLMLFDGDGHEIMSSNSYTGFSAGGPDSNMNEEYGAVLMGYPSVVVGPEVDPYSGEQEIETAILLTKEDGQPDGFLFAVFDCDSLNAELKEESIENIVNGFAVMKGYKAAVIRDEDGVFIAHTDKDMIGAEAAYYLPEEVYATEYEGFTEYDGRSVYVSSVSDGERTLLVMVPNRQDDNTIVDVFLLIGVLLLILAFLYCPKASMLCYMAMEEARKRAGDDNDALMSDQKNPLMVFFYGYTVILTVLAAAALLAAYTMVWPAFTFIFGGMWSRGVSLLSLWAAVFFLAVTLSAVIIIRRMLRSAESRADYRTRTVIRLVDSFVAYAAGILILVVVLYMFGVNTTALLASAGIVSIAVGMGSQSMVSDILAGLFLAIEDSVHMGDLVSVGSWKGRVTDMGIRTTKITDEESRNVMILNNSRISDVVNMSRNKVFCELELVLELDEGMGRREMILDAAVAHTLGEMPELYGSLKLEEIYDVTEKGCTVYMTYSCAEVEREAVEKKVQEFFEKNVKKAVELSKEGSL